MHDIFVFKKFSCFTRIYLKCRNRCLLKTIRLLPCLLLPFKTPTHILYTSFAMIEIAVLSWKILSYHLIFVDEYSGECIISQRYMSILFIDKHYNFTMILGWIYRTKLVPLIYLMRWQVGIIVVEKEIKKEFSWLV